jgi:hypothetical protein
MRLLKIFFEEFWCSWPKPSQKRASSYCPNFGARVSCETACESNSAPCSSHLYGPKINASSVSLRPSPPGSSYPTYGAVHQAFQRPLQMTGRDLFWHSAGIVDFPTPFFPAKHLGRSPVCNHCAEPHRPRYWYRGKYSSLVFQTEA